MTTMTQPIHPHCRGGFKYDDDHCHDEDDNGNIV
jgi:hypothetical protein